MCLPSLSLAKKQHYYSTSHRGTPKYNTSLFPHILLLDQSAHITTYCKTEAEHSEPKKIVWCDLYIQSQETPQFSHVT